MIGKQFPPFEVIVDCPFQDITLNKDLKPIDKKFCLCMVNDFEDGAWMLDSFMDCVWDNIAETALSAEERSALGNRPSSLLTKAARNLRITNNDVTGGEIAEILLYAIMKNYYGALPVVPKIFYKQNVNDFAKGADSVHVIVENDGTFSFWLGEAKFYDSIENARLGTIVKSVHETLTKDKIKKENSIVVGLKDLDNLGLQDYVVNTIKELLGRDVSIDKLKPHLHVPILLLHKCEITEESKSLSDEYKSSIKDKYIDRATAYFQKQIEECSDNIYLYSEITFHLILIPVPDKMQIVNKFIERANVYR